MVIYNSTLAKLLLWEGYHTITIGPFILTKKTKAEVNPAIIHHERIHVAQWLEVSALSIFIYVWTCVLAHLPIETAWFTPLCFMVYYLIYGVEYAISRLRGPETQNEDYHHVEFEKEAYKHQGDPTYLAHRIPFNWIFKR